MISRAVRGSIRGLIPVISGFPFDRGFWVHEREKVMKSSRVLGIEREESQATRSTEDSSSCVRSPLLFLDKKKIEREKSWEMDKEPGGRVVHDQPLSVRGSVFSVRLLLRERLGKWPSRNNFLWGFVAILESLKFWSGETISRCLTVPLPRLFLSFVLRCCCWCTRYPHEPADACIYSCFRYRLC